jgi:peptide-methionine (S)-S-oxide reductase
MQSSIDKEITTLAGGCFSCLEAVFSDLKGVERVEAGYMGGAIPNPTHDQVCSGNTGHAEAIQVTFTPGIVTLKEILEVFFTMHDPTTLNRQGEDVGTQYRSAIFYHSPQQKEIAEATIKEINLKGIWDSPIVTQVTPATDFYRAADNLQEYYQRNGELPYCQTIIAPKVAKFRKYFLDKVKK